MLPTVFPCAYITLDKESTFHCSESRMWWRVSQDRWLLHSFLRNSPATFWLHMGSSIDSNQISHSHCSWSPSTVQLEDFTRTVSSPLSTTEIKPMWLPNRRASMPCGMTDRPHCFPDLLLETENNNKKDKVDSYACAQALST